MLKKLMTIFWIVLPGIVLSQENTKTIKFSASVGVAIFNHRPSSGLSFGNSFVFHDETKKHFFETSIRYTFASELQNELSKPIYSQGYTDFDPQFNSVVSTVDFAQNVGYVLLKREKIFLSLSAGIGIRKWSEVKNGEIVITEMVWEPYFKIRDALTVYDKVWQLGGNMSGKVEFLPAKRVSFGYKTQYCVYSENNCWYNELYFVLKIPKLK